jgi:hypothetical protein
MVKKPNVLILISLSLIAVTVSFPLQIAVIYGYDVNQLAVIFSKLSWFNWLVMIGALVCALLVDRVSRWTLYALPVWLLVAGLNNWLVAYYHGSDSRLLQAGLATLGLVFMMAPIYRHSMMDLFLNPAHCWWKRAERRRLLVPVSVFTGLRQASLVAETFDISESGVFIPCAPELVNDENLLLDFHFRDNTQWSCRARVVRRASAFENHPQGIGVEFLEMNWRRRRRLRQLIVESLS